jgi:hypothetical protein
MQILLPPQWGGKMIYERVNGWATRVENPKHYDHIYEDYMHFGFVHIKRGSKSTELQTPKIFGKREQCEEYLLRAARCIAFIDSTGLEPKYFKHCNSEYMFWTGYFFNDLKKIVWADNETYWEDKHGNSYLLIETFDAPKNWQNDCSSAGFASIEIPKPIAPYGGIKNGPWARSFLLTKEYLKSDSPILRLIHILIKLNRASVLQREEEEIK